MPPQSKGVLPNHALRCAQGRATQPPKGVTRWVAFDEGRRYIESEPAVAVPDLR